MEERPRLLSEVGAKAGTAKGRERLLAKLVLESRSVGVAGEVGVPGMKGLGAGRSSAQQDCMPQIPPLCDSCGAH